MKNFSFSILFAFLFIALFASCDNEYNNLNKGNGIFYYGLDNELRGFYGFLKGEQYYFEDHKDYKVCNISIPLPPFTSGSNSDLTYCFVVPSSCLTVLSISDIVR